MPSKLALNKETIMFAFLQKFPKLSKLFLRKKRSILPNEGLSSIATIRSCVKDARGNFKNVTDCLREPLRKFRKCLKDNKGIMKDRMNCYKNFLKSIDADELSSTGNWKIISKLS